MAALELRAEKLERRLRHARLRKASVALHDTDAPPVAPQSHFDLGRKDSLAILTAAIHRKAAQNRENSDGNSLVSDFGFLYVDHVVVLLPQVLLTDSPSSIDAATRDFEPSEVNISFARLVLAASTNDPIPDLDDTEAGLPERQVVDSIIQFYETNVLELYPIFDVATLRSLANDMYADDPRPMRSWEYWMFWMVLAIGSTAQSQSKEDEHYLRGLDFVARALTRADRALMPGYVTQLQSLILLTQYSMLDPVHFDSWPLLGFTCRAIIDLGFHKDPPQPEKETLDARRRTFYCVYALDRLVVPPPPPEWYPADPLYRAISMVHARAFSFDDDAVSVGLPSRPPPNDGSIGQQRPSDASIPLFMLRQLQSEWYQRLFKCDPDNALPDPTSYIWQKCCAMRLWSEKLPADLPLSIREMFDLELRYSYVYCIAPSTGAPHLTAYQRLLIFEHVIGYIDRIHHVAHASSNAAFYTYHDVLKVYFMGSQFVAVLRDAAESLLNGTPPPAPFTVPGKSAPPPIPQRFGTLVDNLDRSLKCLEKTSLTLKRYGQRWQNALTLLETFDMISAQVTENLRGREKMRDAASPSNHETQAPRCPLPDSQPRTYGSPGQQSPYTPMSQHSPHPSIVQRPSHSQHSQQHSQDASWLDVDVSQMIQGGGRI